MDGYESTAKSVENTYKNIIDEFGPCMKQLVVAGRTYLKSIHGMIAANRNYTDALFKIATLADKSTMHGSTDIGAALHHIVEINREMQAQQSNIMKSLEFDFLEPMEITADKDTKLIGKELKRFQQLHRGRRDDFEKSISTLKKSRRKKTINTDKQLAHIQVMENSKSRLDLFCEESLKEAIVQERILYGTVLERQCALKKQILVYYSKGCELLEANLPHWDALAETRESLPENCFPLHHEISDKKKFFFNTMDGAYQTVSPVDSVVSGAANRSEQSSTISSAVDSTDSSGIYSRPIMRAKSEYNLSNEQAPPYPGGTLTNRYSRAVEFNGEIERNYVRTIFAYKANGDYQLSMVEGDIIEYTGDENSSGWQFGDNLRSKRSGWFPLSYTRPLAVETKSPKLVRREDITMEQRMMEQSNIVRGPYYQQLETSDYGTLKASPKKIVPVKPPVVNNNNNTLQHLQSPSQKIISRAPRRHTIMQPKYADDAMIPPRDRYAANSSNPQLQSMHL